MGSVFYKIQAGSASQFKQRRIIVRSFDPDKIFCQLSDKDLDNVDHVQLLSPAIENAKIENISKWRNQVPIDIYLSDPRSEFPLLYNFSKLGGRHPVRVTVPVKRGFIKAVKLATALNFAVKLDVDNPNAEALKEMAAVLELYLHRSTVSQPIEFFHSIFLSFYLNEPADLWMIQEDDPEHFRFVTDDGIEMPRAKKALPNECGKCEFREVCKGYFKRSLSDYDCRGILSIFKTLEAAALELRENVMASSAPSGRSPQQ